MHDTRDNIALNHVRLENETRRLDELARRIEVRRSVYPSVRPSVRSPARPHNVPWYAYGYMCISQHQPYVVMHRSACTHKADCNDRNGRFCVHKIYLSGAAQQARKESELAKRREWAAAQEKATSEALASAPPPAPHTHTTPRT